MTFNDTSAPFARFLAEQDPFAALASFATVYPSLQPGLAQLLDPAASSPDFLSAVVQSFSTLVKQIGAVWSGIGNGAAALAVPPTKVSRTYRIDYIYTLDNPPNYKSLELTRLTGLPLDWPDIAVFSPPTAATPTVLTLESGHTDTLATYDFPTGSGSSSIQAFRPMSVRFTFGSLDVVQNQSAWGGVYLMRNAQLVSDVPTAQAFVYQTPLTRFNDTVIPLIVNQLVIPFGTGTDFASGIEALLGELLDASPPDYKLSAGATLKFSLLYGHTLRVADGDPEASIVALVPVFFLPPLNLDQTAPPPSMTIPAFSGHLDEGLEAWIKLYDPVMTAGDRFVIEITLLSAIPGETTRPLLQLGRLTYTISGPNPTKSNPP